MLIKAMHVDLNHVRGLKGVLIMRREPTRPMLTEAASAGLYSPRDSQAAMRVPKHLDHCCPR